MNNLLVFLNYLNGKTETFISDQLQYFDKEGISYNILAYNYAGNNKNIYSNIIPKKFLHRLKNIRFKSYREFYFFLCCLKYRNGFNLSLYLTGKHFLYHQYKVIYCHFGANGKLVAELKALGIICKKTKVIVQFHGLDLALKKYKPPFYNILNHQVDVIIVGSNYAKNMLSLLNINQTKVELIPASINFDKIPFPIERERHNEIKIISVGRLISLKGHFLALDIISILKNSLDIKISYQIIGEGPLKDDLISKIKDLELENEVCLSGFLPHFEVFNQINKSHIYLYAGNHDQEGRVEMQGLANIEAMALGLLVVCSRVGGIVDYIDNGRNGYFIDPNDFSECVDIIKQSILDYNNLDELRKNAINDARDNFNSKTNYSKIIQMIDN